MPLKHICPAAGCSVLLGPGASHCPRHRGAQAERQAAYDHSIRHTRDSAFTAFYHSPEWKRTVEYIRARYKGLCLWSYYRGEIAPMEAVHHIEPIKADWSLRLNIDNLIPLSHAAHMQIEAQYKQDAAAAKQKLRALLRRWTHEFGDPGE